MKWLLDNDKDIDFSDNNYEILKYSDDNQETKQWIRHVIEQRGFQIP